MLDGHKMTDPEGSTFARVVPRESVWIAFTYAVLNGLDVFAADIRNAYLQAPSSQRDCIISGPKFGIENVGHVALVHRALYGRKLAGKDFQNRLRSCMHHLHFKSYGRKLAGKDFQNHLRSCMHHLHFKSCPTDPNVWM